MEKLGLSANPCSCVAFTSRTRHVTKRDKPVLLQSQMEISIGKQKPVVLSFLLPHASCTKMDRKKFRGRMATDNYNMASRIGEALVRSMTGWLTIQQLVEAIWARTQRDGKNPFASKTLLSKNVQHVLTINRYFELGPPVEPGMTRAWRIKQGQETRYFDSGTATRWCHCTPPRNLIHQRLSRISGSHMRLTRRGNREL